MLARRHAVKILLAIGATTENLYPISSCY